MKTPAAVRDDLRAFRAVVGMRLPKWIVRLWCRHPDLYVPIPWRSGPAPYQECPFCGYRQILTAEDYNRPDGLNLISTTGIIIDMNGYHRNEDMAKRMGIYSSES